ncbi:hypothetical protein D3C78_1733780 [compost metagenome]
MRLTVFIEPDVLKRRAAHVTTITTGSAYTLSQNDEASNSPCAVTSVKRTTAFSENSTNRLLRMATKGKGWRYR